jgi:hypothetical protein
LLAAASHPPRWFFHDQQGNNGNISYIGSFNNHENLLSIKKTRFALPRFFHEERGLSYQIA